MFNRSKCIIIAVSMLLAFSAAAFAADVAITSVGQSPDGMMVKVMMKKLKIEPDYDALMKSVGGQKVLIAVVGGSSKGLGAAGIDKEQEKARFAALAESAHNAGMKIVVMHIGGEGRRGALSDEFINVAAPLGDRVIVVKGGNDDGIFASSKADGADLIEVENLQAAAGPLGDTLKEWGVN